LRHPILLDWGFSVREETNTSFCGGIDCAADEVLNKIGSGPGDAFEYKPEYDLISFVRTVYIMLHAPEDFHQLSFGKENTISEHANNISDFWKCHAVSISDLWNVL